MRNALRASLAVAAATIGCCAGDARARAAGDAALGEYLAAECVTCHQLSGQYHGIPPIVGWPAASFVEILTEYRLKRRANPVMQTVAARLSDDDMAALAAYFGSLPAQRSRH
jgi:cytochrome c553